MWKTKNEGLIIRKPAQSLFLLSVPFLFFICLFVSGVAFFRFLTLVVCFIYLKVRYFQRGLSKSLLKVNFIFSFEPSPFFNGQDYEKQKGPRTSDQSFFRLQNKFRKISLLPSRQLPVQS